MALPRAVLLGAVAAIGVPLALRRLHGPIVDTIQQSTTRFEFYGVPFHWSWPVFCVVTLAAWALFRAAGTD